MSTKETTRSKLAGQAIVIPGEASETDEETEDDHIQNRNSTSANLPTRTTSSTVHSNATNLKPKYDSLLHRKLREAQINFAVDAANFTGRTTQQMMMEMQRVSQSVNACQLTLQDATCHIRSVADDLYKIDDNLDAVFHSHALIPELANFDNYPTVKQYIKSTK